MSELQLLEHANVAWARIRWTHAQTVIVGNGMCQITTLAFRALMTFYGLTSIMFACSILILRLQGVISSLAYVEDDRSFPFPI